MKVTVNRTKLEIFAGAKVADAVRMYYARHKKAIPRFIPEVRDRFGNEVAPDGAISEGSHFIIVKKPINS